MRQSRATRVMTVCFLLAGAALGGAEGFRLGAGVSAEFAEPPSLEGVVMEFDERANLIPGMYWEYVPKNLGIGMTALLDLNRSSAPAPVYHELWLDWIASLDLRYHLLGGHAVLDPFLEAGFGAAGRSDVTDYEAASAGANDYTPTNLSLFGQVGAGLAFRLWVLQVGAKADWRFWSAAAPGTSYDPYPLKSVSVALFGGLAF